MADEADIAQRRMEQEEVLREKARQTVKEVSEDCHECGDRISAGHQKATGGTSMCFECANKAETKRKHYR